MGKALQSKVVRDDMVANDVVAGAVHERWDVSFMNERDRALANARLAQAKRIAWMLIRTAQAAKGFARMLIAEIRRTFAHQRA
jgi:hypothetical protein